MGEKALGFASHKCKNRSMLYPHFREMEAQQLYFNKVAMLNHIGLQIQEFTTDLSKTTIQIEHLKDPKLLLHLN